MKNKICVCEQLDLDYEINKNRIKPFYKENNAIIKLFGANWSCLYMFRCDNIYYLKIDGEDSYDLNINYCPLCGRKLNKKKAK